MDAKPHNVTVVDHPLVQHKLTLMRKRDTAVVQFRQLAPVVERVVAVGPVQHRRHPPGEPLRAPGARQRPFGIGIEERLTA